MTKINKSRLLRLLAIVTVLVTTSVAFAFAADPTDITGYHLVYRPLYDYIDTFLEPVCTLLVAIGSVYAIVLGVKYAKAEEPQEREKTKVAVKNLLIGFIAVFVIYAVWQLLMNLVIVPYAVSETNDLDNEWVTQSSEGDDLNTNNYVNNNTDYQSIKEARNAASDNNTTGPTSTQKERNDDGEPELPGDETNPSVDPNTSSSQVNPDGTTTPTEDQVDPLKPHITRTNNAVNALKTLVTQSGGSESDMKGACAELDDAIYVLKGAIEQYGATIEANKVLASAEKTLAEAKEIASSL